MPFPCGVAPTPTDLMAHWAFDETAGRVVSDSVGGRDGVLVGGPVWQPDSGKIGGALKLDGISDFVVTDVLLDPADGPFSVYAWIKSGAPGEAVLSQDGADWLLTDPANGQLTTGLKGTGQSASSLYSKKAVTDGNWHHVGLVWDGANRTLYVDGIAVATDRLTAPAGSFGGLIIGAGRNLEPATAFGTFGFWICFGFRIWRHDPLAEKSSRRARGRSGARPIRMDRTGPWGALGGQVRPEGAAGGYFLDFLSPIE